MSDTQKVKDLSYPAKESERLARLRDRITILQARIQTSQMKNQNTDKAELSALEWAIMKIAKQRAEITHLEACLEAERRTKNANER